MLIVACASLLLPFGTTLMVTGNIYGLQYDRQQERAASGNYRILLDRSDSGEKGKWLSLEEYLPSVLAVQISPDSEMEAIKALAVIARTYIRQQMENGTKGSETSETEAAQTDTGETETDGEIITAASTQKIWEISETELGLAGKPREELKKTWGTDGFLEKYSRLEEAAAQTAGIVLTYQGKLITPLFCKLSAGNTREGGENYPYLSKVSCPDDVQAEDFIHYLAYSGKHFRHCNCIFGYSESLQSLFICRSCFPFVIRRFDVRCNLYGYRLRYFTDEQQRNDHLWNRNRPPHSCNPCVRRLSGRNVVRYPDHERFHSADQQIL